MRGPRAACKNRQRTSEAAHACAHSATKSRTRFSSRRARRRAGRIANDRTRVAFERAAARDRLFGALRWRPAAEAVAPLGECRRPAPVTAVRVHILRQRSGRFGALRGRVTRRTRRRRRVDRRLGRAQPGRPAGVEGLRARRARAPRSGCWARRNASAGERVLEGEPARGGGRLRRRVRWELLLRRRVEGEPSRGDLFLRREVEHTLDGTVKLALAGTVRPQRAEVDDARRAARRRRPQRGARHLRGPVWTTGVWAEMNTHAWCRVGGGSCRLNLRRHAPESQNAHWRADADVTYTHRQSDTGVGRGRRSCPTPSATWTAWNAPKFPARACIHESGANLFCSTFHLFFRYIFDNGPLSARLFQFSVQSAYMQAYDLPISPHEKSPIDNHLLVIGGYLRLRFSLAASYSKT